MRWRTRTFESTNALNRAPAPPRAPPNLLPGKAAHPGRHRDASLQLEQVRRAREDGPLAWFDDGESLFAVVVAQGLEGIVAKRQASRYRPGERGWVKIKNRDYWRYPHEVEAMRRVGERRQKLTI